MGIGIAAIKVCAHFHGNGRSFGCIGRITLVFKKVTDGPAIRNDITCKSPVFAKYPVKIGIGAGRVVAHV